MKCIKSWANRNRKEHSGWMTVKFPRSEISTDNCAYIFLRSGNTCQMPHKVFCYQTNHWLCSPHPPLPFALLPFQLTQTVISCLRLPTLLSLPRVPRSRGSPCCVRNFRFGRLSWESLTHTHRLRGEYE